MRVLIVPMSAMAETAGTFSRAKLLASDLKKANIEVAVCSAGDPNSEPIPGAANYVLSTPVPLGLPKPIGAHAFAIAQKLGVTSRKSVPSFEDVLHVTGNTNYRYLKSSVDDIKKAIRDFNPDVIYSEFNISAILAGKIENKRVFISASIPTQYEYGSAPRYAGGLNRVLKEYGLPPVTSCLELFSWAEKKFVPSCYELEPFQDQNVVFCGAWKHRNLTLSQNRNKILVYMGTGTISQGKMIKEVVKAFKNSAYPVYIAGRGLTRRSLNPIQIAPYFDFQALLPDALLFLNHGGQNSVMDGLIYGVPQLICPGKVFERRYNAQSVVKVGAGLEISYKNFTENAIRTAFETLISTPAYRESALKIGQIASSLGGAKNIIGHLK